MKPVITIDIDGVVFDTPNWTSELFNRGRPNPVPITQLFNVNAKHNQDLLVEKTKGGSIDHYHKTQAQTDLYKVDAECLKALKTLHNRFTLIALTSRNHVKFKQVTGQVIEKFVGRYIDRIVYNSEIDNDSENSNEKGTLAKQLHSVLHIDDGVGYCRSCRKVGIPAILFVQPYNQNADYDPTWRANNWSDVVNIVTQHFPVVS